MDVLVAGDSGAIIPPIAELEEARGLERTLRSVAEEALPIDGLGSRIRWHGIPPGANSVRPIDGTLHHEDSSNRARVKPFFGFARGRHVDGLAANLYQPAGLSRYRGH